jgi:8-oxo-dGTP diphosphatase
LGKQPIINVVAGIIIHDGKILLARRAPHKVMPGKWEFPGGKVEGRENPGKALEREIYEEFGVHIEVGDFFYQNIHDYGEFKIVLDAYFGDWIDGEFSLKDHDTIEWVRREDLKNFDLTEADIPFVRLLEEI